MHQKYICPYFQNNFYHIAITLETDTHYKIEVKYTYSLQFLQTKHCININTKAKRPLEVRFKQLDMLKYFYMENSFKNLFFVQHRINSLDYTVLYLCNFLVYCVKNMQGKKSK